MSSAISDPRVDSKMAQLTSAHLQSEAARKERLEEIDKMTGQEPPQKIAICKSCFTKLDGRPHRPACKIDPGIAKPIHKVTPQVLFVQSACVCGGRIFSEVGKPVPEFCDACQRTVSDKGISDASSKVRL